MSLENTSESLLLTLESKKGVSMKIIKTDFIVATIVIGAWIFYLNFDGATRFDISQSLTLPLLLAADFTGLALLYVIGRYLYIKKNSSLIDVMLKNPGTDNQAEQAQDENNGKNQSPDNKS